MAKKILIFSFAYYPLVGGAEIAVKEITDRISGMEFDMITCRFSMTHKEFEKIGNVNVFRTRCLNRHLFPFFGLFKALSLFRKNNYSAIWSIMANYAGFTALLFKLIRKNVPFILTLQEGDPFSHIKQRVGIFFPLYKLIFKKADVIQTISNYLADFARSMGAKAPIFVVPNGVDVELFGRRIGNQESRIMKEKLGIVINDRTIITTSRLVAKNGVGDIVRALLFLPENYKFIILGIGPLEKSLKLLVKSLKLEGRVKFLGQVDNKKIPAYLQVSDIFVRASLSEGMGNSFIEAMAAGIPVIATRVGGIVDFLKDPSENSGQATGLFCELNNPKSIAMKIQELLKHPDKNRILANAKALAIKNYDWNLITQNMETTVFNF